ncbi:modulator of apoptosis 1-like [Lingula anatina]|uniref:Modulator of apoptosis 1-like n=1 Tax=Lingula anatina TaxID=7574 RepID=A0A1S3HJS2_LINAN|nr:modulator of apoptosis 1-like [Lingula anatina]|eukprot:XP_013386267.1 modulator of apoptosis 1-like [Lingula anatina]
MAYPSSLLRSRSIVITGLPDQITDSELKDFLKFHLVSEFTIEYIHRPDTILGAIFVVFEDAALATEAIDILDKRKYDGQTVDVKKINKSMERDILDALETKESKLSEVIGMIKSLPADDIVKVYEEVKSLLPKSSKPKFPVNSTPKRTPIFRIQKGSTPRRLLPKIPTFSTSGSELVSYTHPPRLPLFSGDSKDASFKQWLFEVKALRRDGIYSDAVLLHAIRRSLKSPASDVLYHLGDVKEIDRVLEKFEQVFGDVLSSGAILQQFHSSKQHDSESIAAWACRLESLVAQLLSINPPAVTDTGAKSMLRLKFYSGLNSNTIRHLLKNKFDGGATFEELLVEGRTIEMEEKERFHLDAAVSDMQSGGLMKAIDSLSRRLSGLELV